MSEEEDVRLARFREAREAVADQRAADAAALAAGRGTRRRELHRRPMPRLNPRTREQDMPRHNAIDLCDALKHDIAAGPQTLNQLGFVGAAELAEKSGAHHAGDRRMIGREGVADNHRKTSPAGAGDPRRKSEASIA